MTELEKPDMSLQRALIETFAEALETMAFISPSPLPAPPAEVPPGLCTVSIRFNGTSNGSLRITASGAFGVLLAANLTGVDPSDPGAAACGDDALKELANVVCGLLLRRQHAPFELAPPVIELAAVSVWPKASAVSPVLILDAEGHAIMAQLFVDGAFHWRDDK